MTRLFHTVLFMGMRRYAIARFDAGFRVGVRYESGMSGRYVAYRFNERNRILLATHQPILAV
jgi:hypothetical protein